MSDNDPNKARSVFVKVMLGLLLEGTDWGAFPPLLNVKISTSGSGSGDSFYRVDLEAAGGSWVRSAIIQVAPGIAANARAGAYAIAEDLLTKLGRREP